MTFKICCLSLIIGLLLVACTTTQNESPQNPESEVVQATLSSQNIKLIARDEFNFKDLNKDGELNDYEDWRLSPLQRSKDLLARMTIEEKAGKLLHGNLFALPSGAYNIEHAQRLILELHVGSGISRLASDVNLMASGNNQLQVLAESTRLGIPLSISTDPRNHFQYLEGASISAGSFSQWPEPIGFAAIGNADTVRKFADVARQEYRAVGIVQALSPMADLATEPRWSRVPGTFGENASLAKTLVQAYIEGFQAGADGLHDDSVAAVVKHWVGYGAAKDGYDSHNYYGRFATFPGNNFAEHIVPFEGAFAANVSGVMPTFSILENLIVEGTAIEQVGAGYSEFLLQDLLRTQYNFNGVILSDWAITRDCNELCLYGEFDGEVQEIKDISAAWGVIDLSQSERFAKAMRAGVDQFGGINDATPLLKAIESGLISEAQVDQSALRILQQKFALGLFENPFVDEQAARELVGNSEFEQLANSAQSQALVLLENKDNFLPIINTKQKVFLKGIDASAAEALGFTVVAKAGQADFAIIRTVTPFEQPHKGYVFGRRYHEDNLAFLPGNPDHDLIVEVSEKIPTIVTVYLDRPAILNAFNDKVTALIGNFGVSDQVLLSVITGVNSPIGKLPIELPSSMRAVEAQQEDLPHDSTAPIYPYGYGLEYE